MEIETYVKAAEWTATHFDEFLKIVGISVLALFVLSVVVLFILCWKYPSKMKKWAKRADEKMAYDMGREYDGRPFNPFW